MAVYTTVWVISANHLQSASLQFVRRLSFLPPLRPDEPLEMRRRPIGAAGTSRHEAVRPTEVLGGDPARAINGSVNGSANGSVMGRGRRPVFARDKGGSWLRSVRLWFCQLRRLVRRGRLLDGGRP